MLWTCRRCTTQFAVGLPYCPQCTGTDIEKENDVPKNHASRGPTYEEALPGQLADDEQAAEQADTEQGKGYSESTVAELKDEIDRRNAERVDDDRLPIAPEGRAKSDLIAALEADDGLQGQES